MAVVYLVEHQTLLKRFAVKVLSAEHASNEEARARFTQEAHAASQLDHENIVTISDFGITPDERPFYVMELLRGRTLMDRLEEGPMTIEEVVAVSVPVARALAHAHAEGVIHRDVKPENVFLVQRSQGRWGVKVLDFGIAKVTTNPALTKMGQALGSPMYMAPEACRGDDVDPRADLYSFGIILYFMLTGKVPFSDESLLKVLQMQVSAPVPSMREINPELSPELEAVVMRALAKNPDDRYPTMDALLFDLQAVLPEGSDNLLMQAQFGTSLHDTPFPSQSLRMIALSSQRLMIGDKDASTQLDSPSASARFPSVPAKRRRGALVALGIAIPVLAIGGVAAYWWQGRAAGNDAPIAIADQAIVPTAPNAVPPPSDPTPTPAPTPAPPETPTPVEPPPAADSAVPALAASEEDPTPATPKDPDPTPVVAPKPAVAAPNVRRVTPPKRVVATARKVETPAPKPVTPPKTGSAAEPKPAVVATPVVPKETPRVVVPPPPPVVIPPKPVKPVAPVINAGSLDATPTITRLDVNGPLPSSVVRRTVQRALPALRACYRTAAKAHGSTPPVTLYLSFEIDEHSSLRRVSGRGGNLASLVGCARGAVSGLQTQQAPDVGTANVVVTITFRPT